MRTLILLCIALLLSGCASDFKCGPGGLVVRYYEIKTCFWPEAPRKP